MSDIRTTPSVTPQNCLNFADAALYLAGHTVADPYLRELHAKAASGEITVEEAGHLGEEYLCATFGVNHE